MTISGHAGTDLTVSGTTLTNNVLTFTDQNWGTAQTVTVKAAEDGDADQDADVTLVHAIGSTADSDYAALADQSVTVSITENDEVGVTINPTSLTVTEGDATGNSYTVVLTSQPAGDVTIDHQRPRRDGPDPVRYDAHQQRADLHGSELGHGPDGEGGRRRGRRREPTDPDVTLAHDISSTDDTDYAALADQSVTVSITENDVVGVTINPTVSDGD